MAKLNELVINETKSAQNFRRITLVGELAQKSRGRALNTQHWLVLLPLLLEVFLLRIP